MKYLVKQLRGTKAAAQVLGISQRAVERYVTGGLKRPRQEPHARLEREVKKHRQPQIRAKAGRGRRPRPGWSSPPARTAWTLSAACRRRG